MLQFGQVVINENLRFSNPGPDRRAYGSVNESYQSGLSLIISILI